MDDFYNVGIWGKIIQVLKFPDGSIKALIEGENRIKVHNLQQEDDVFKSHYEILHEVTGEGPDIKALLRFTFNKFQEYLQKSIKMSAEHFVSITEIREPGKLADVIATYLSISISEKQEILEELNANDRLEKINKILSKEIELLGIEESIQEKVKYKIGKTQKEFLLREKLQAIREELGSEGGIDEVEELRATIEKSKIPQKVKEQLNKELSSLKKCRVIQQKLL